MIEHILIGCFYVIPMLVCWRYAIGHILQFSNKGLDMADGIVAGGLVVIGLVPILNIIMWLDISNSGLHK